MAKVQMNFVRSFEFDIPDRLIPQIERTREPLTVDEVDQDAALSEFFDIATEAFTKWIAYDEDAKRPFEWGDCAGCTVGEDVLYTFDLISHGADSGGMAV